MCIRFPYTKEGLRRRILAAVRSYWTGRSQQKDRQLQRGNHDTGTRSEVTGGHQMDAFGEILSDLALRAGYNENDISFSSPLPVPGYYRSQKKWDFSICRNGRLIALIELKSQSGSFGNNFNNRAEEAIGLARDFWIAYRENTFGLISTPWLGYLFLLEDSPKSNTPVKLFPSALPPLNKFANTSYQRRYQILCETMMFERDFSFTSLIVSPRPTRRVSFSEPVNALSFFSFCRSYFHHITAHFLE